MYFWLLAVGFSGLVICKYPAATREVMWRSRFLECMLTPILSSISLAVRGTEQKLTISLCLLDNDTFGVSECPSWVSKPVPECLSRVSKSFSEMSKLVFGCLSRVSESWTWLLFSSTWLLFPWTWLLFPSTWLLSPSPWLLFPSTWRPLGLRGLTIFCSVWAGWPPPFSVKAGDKSWKSA